MYFKILIKKFLEDRKLKFEGLVEIFCLVIHHAMYLLTTLALLDIILDT